MELFQAQDNFIPLRGISYFSKKPDVVIYVHYAHAGVMAHARILLILTRTTRVFLIFVTSAQLINHEFLAFPTVIFFKNRLIS